MFILNVLLPRWLVTKCFFANTYDLILIDIKISSDNFFYLCLPRKWPGPYQHCYLCEFFFSFFLLHSNFYFFHSPFQRPNTGTCTSSCPRYSLSQTRPMLKIFPSPNSSGKTHLSCVSFPRISVIYSSPVELFLGKELIISFSRDHLHFSRRKH